MKINDECHHLTSSNMKLENITKTYIEMLNIKSIKQLSLTATLKNLETSNIDLSIVSNDNINYFGEIIDRKCLLQASDCFSIKPKSNLINNNYLYFILKLSLQDKI